MTKPDPVQAEQRQGNAIHNKQWSDSRPRERRRLRSTPARIRYSIFRFIGVMIFMAIFQARVDDTGGGGGDLPIQLNGHWA